MRPSNVISDWPLGEGAVAAALREHDWEQTPLGAPEGWPERLRLAVETILDDPLPQWVAWGPELAQVANGAARDLTGHAAPGRPLREAWAALWPEAGPAVERVMRTGRAEVVADLSLVPLRDGAGAVRGLRATGLGGVTGRDGARYRSIFTSMDEGCAVIEMIADEAGRWSDFRYLEVNPAFTVHSGVSDPVGLTLTQLLGTPSPRWAQIYGKVAETGEALRFQEPELVLGRVFDLNVFRLGGPGSRQVAVLFSDITARRRSEAALREGQERLEAIFASAPVGLSEVGLDGRFLEVNSELCRILGRGREEVLGLTIGDVTHPDDMAPSLAAVNRALRTGAGADLDKRYRRPDGTLVWANSRITPLRPAAGRPASLLVATVDLTARRAAEAALRESEARFRQFGDAAGDVLWIRNARTLAFEYVSPAFEELYGLPVSEVEGVGSVRPWAALIEPQDRPGVLENLRRVREGEHVLHTFRVRRSDGALRWVRDTSFPLLDEAGQVQRLGGIYHDATEEVDLQERLRVLVAELQHRSRNLVAVVRSVAERTLTSSASLEEFRARFRARLDALGRVNGLLSRLEEGERITFDQLLRTELSALGVLDGEGGGQIRLMGPVGVPLRSATVQTFALALHELATNALKHGALSDPAGRLAVDWRLVAAPGGERRLQVEWRETGAPFVPSDPPRMGYGRELIERALPYQLRAQTRYELDANGLRCSISLPVSTGPELAFSDGEG
ncbi:sensor histidine kinase [Rubellimicrobium roseum]|uniref:histidine kinase n=1 Tax=Rubellimicrobium roseum TaxID=687525 RepID=A0A5C4NCT9_9RHOB|nr:sensor histidine kinase [Rubellimicrobium roseum]TNC72604.1 PAS domain S-box protein [Rubellimicrobium roseum]